MARPPKYSQRQMSYVQRAVRLRRKLSDKAIALRTGLSMRQVAWIASCQGVVSSETYYARVNARRSP